MRAATALLALFVLGIRSPAGATDYYACECGNGAEATCEAGDDTAAGTSPASAWRSASRLARMAVRGECGDTFNLCSGGVFAAPDPPQWTRAGHDCSRRPRIVQSYRSPGSSRRPLIVASAGTFNLDQDGAAGVTIRGLDILCSGACRSGIGTIYANIDAVVVDDVIVDGFNVCVQWGPNRSMGVRNSTIRNCKSQGLIGPAGSGSYVVDSRILHSGCLETTDQATCAFQHAHYWNVSSPSITGLVVRGNHYENNVLSGGSGSCLGNAFVVRGGTGTVVEDNTFVTPSTGGAPHPLCQVVRMSTSQVQQRCDGCAFRGNRIFGGSILLQLESWIGGVVENNLFYSPLSDIPGPKNAVLLNASAAGAAEADGVTIRNNSIVMGNNGNYAASAIGVYAELGSTPHRIESNAIQMLGSGPSDVCFRLISDGIAATVREDYNVCGLLNPNAHFVSTGPARTLAEWRSGTVNGDHSLESDPAFTSPGSPSFDFTLTSSSPARDAGNPSNAPAIDIVGVQRPVGAAPDAGAFEYGGGLPPLAPILLED
jgi:hypothetical protein